MLREIIVRKWKLFAVWSCLPSALKLKRVDSRIRSPNIGCSHGSLMGAIQSNRKPSYDANGEGNRNNDFFFIGIKWLFLSLFSFFAVNFDHFQILRAIGKGAFGKVNRSTWRQATYYSELFNDPIAFVWNLNVLIRIYLIPFCFRSASFRRRTLKLCMQWNTWINRPV